jgi:hypothetical protein
MTDTAQRLHVRGCAQMSGRNGGGNNLGKAGLAGRRRRPEHSDRAAGVVPATMDRRMDCEPVNGPA